MGIISKSIQQRLKDSHIKKITNYICGMSNEIVSDYQTSGERLPNDENLIRTILLEEYLNKEENKSANKMKGFSFDPEAQEHYVGSGRYAGRVDIRIKLKTDFEKKEACYIVECKRIDGSHVLNKKYVEEGVARFVNKKYSTYYGKNLMLGFIVKAVNIQLNANAIESIQNAMADSSMHGNLVMVNTSGYTTEYKCLYKLLNEDIELGHIFSDFSSIM